MIDVALLGCGGTQPLPGRALASLAVRCGGHTVLVDCGEGTQTAAHAAGVSLAKADVICLTHYHGDHIFGLPGLLQTIANQGRTEPLQLVGPEGLSRWGGLLLALAGPLPFSVEQIEVAESHAVVPLPGFGGLQLAAFGVSHRVPCLGYTFTLPRAGRFLPEKARQLDVPVAQWKTLQQGMPVLAAGRTVQPQQVLGPARKGLRLVYSTDTRPCPTLEKEATGADLLICDATYADATDAAKAEQYGHSTFAQAAALAARAGAKRLWLTHYSAALSAPEEKLAEARQIFAQTEAGFDGKKAQLSFAEN